MASTILTSGTHTTASANEESVYVIANASLSSNVGTYVVRFNTENMVNGDIFEFRIYSQSLPADTIDDRPSRELVQVVTYANQQGNANEPLNATTSSGTILKDSPPTIVVRSGEITIKRISATNRAFDYVVVRIDP